MNFSMKMAPNHHFMLNGLPMEPVSRTYQYRKIMKPMLERKRRARINKCLDELKDLMTGTLQADGENVSKLEKADILELTVRHLHRLREHNTLFLRGTDSLNMEKFWAGFQHCAVEVSQFLSKYDQHTNHTSADLIKYIASYVPNITATTSPTSTATLSAINKHYQRFYTTISQLPTSDSTVANLKIENVEPIMQNISETNLHTLPSTAMPHRLHPYARRALESNYGARKQPGERIRDRDKCVDGVWRPW